MEDRETFGTEPIPVLKLVYQIQLWLWRPPERPGCHRLDTLLLSRDIPPFWHTVVIDSDQLVMMYFYYDVWGVYPLNVLIISDEQLTKDTWLPKDLY